MLGAARGSRKHAELAIRKEWYTICWSEPAVATGEDTMNLLSFRRFILAFALGLLSACGGPGRPELVNPGMPDADTPDTHNGVTDVNLDPPATPELGWQYAIPA